MLLLDKVSKSYIDGDRKLPVLENINLSLEEGESVALLGKSGSGKSTLLNIIAGLDSPDKGGIYFYKTNLSSQTKDWLADFRLKSIGLIFQFFNFLPTLTIAQNIAIPGLLLNVSSVDIKIRQGECLGVLGISHIKDRLPHEVSGGELQRAAIARAIFNKPRLLLADEPTGNLDSDNAANVISIFLDIAKQTKTALLIVTHDKDLALRTDREVLLSNGSIENESI